jgi:pimeloyl-ACP methyl ester carboxylesterase
MFKNTQILNYRIVGKGYPVVFLHGFLESNAMWKNILPGLNNIQAICIELPGHGESPLLEEMLSLPIISKAVKNTIESLSIKPFSIVGHSLGGYVALHLAEDPTLKIDNIVLLHSHPWADKEKKKGDRNRVAKIVNYNKMLFLNEAIPSLYHQPEKYETIINHLIEEAYKMSEDAIVQTLFAMRDREEKTNVLKDLGKRIHIIQGEFDQLINAKEMEEALGDTGNNFHLIENIGHMGHDEARDEVIKHLGSLLKSQIDK